jgi:hypothetical protein
VYVSILVWIVFVLMLDSPQWHNEAFFGYLLAFMVGFEFDTVIKLYKSSQHHMSTCTGKVNKM